jgi:hypothetical protein
MKPILEAMCQHWNYGFFTTKLQKHPSESARCLAVAVQAPWLTHAPPTAVKWWNLR